MGFESINMDVAFFGSRYGKGEFEEGDYINCPLNRDQYEEFVNNVKDAERIELHSFESAIESGVKAGAHKFFEGCLPVEIIAQRGRDTLAYGPMRPVGLIDPKTNRRAYAVVQLRRDNIAGTLYNMVGFQTNLKFPEQKRVFQSVPGLANAEFARYGQMHRNTFISAPKLLKPTMQFRRREDLFSDYGRRRLRWKFCYWITSWLELSTTVKWKRINYSTKNNNSGFALPLRYTRKFSGFSANEG